MLCGDCTSHRMRKWMGKTERKHVEKTSELDARAMLQQKQTLSGRRTRERDQKNHETKRTSQRHDAAEHRANLYLRAGQGARWQMMHPGLWTSADGSSDRVT
jgi:hypothetical protein